jgi:histidinol-phosphate aminotransferase
VSTVVIRPAILGVTPSAPHRPMAQIAIELGLKRVIKLGANEDPGGPLPAAMAAYVAAASTISRYPDSRAVELRDRLAADHGVPEECVLIGNGADELIRMTASLVLNAGDHAVYPWPSFPSYRDSVMCCGGSATAVPAAAGALVERLLVAARKPRTRLLYLSNPNNPTGTALAPEEVRRLVERVEPCVLCVIDEAYAHYADTEPRAADLVVAGVENVCVLRTFSKIHGLAGLRIGYAVGPAAVIAALERMRLVFNVNLAAQVAALAALDEHEAIAERAAYARRSRRRLFDMLAAAGLEPLPSQANFVFARAPSGDGEAFARRLLLEGIAVRALAGFGAPEAVRVTIGTEEELDVLEGALGRLREEAP